MVHNSWPSTAGRIKNTRKSFETATAEVHAALEILILGAECDSSAGLGRNLG